MTDVSCVQTLTKILKEYPGYAAMREFAVGFEDYQRGLTQCPYSSNSVEGQAWDRGAEAAMRYLRTQSQE